MPAGRVLSVDWLRGSFRGRAIVQVGAELFGLIAAVSLDVQVGFSDLLLGGSAAYISCLTLAAAAVARRVSVDTTTWHARVPASAR